MQVHEIARAFDAASAEFVALLDAGDDYRGIMEGLDHAAATQQMAIAVLTKARAGSPEALMVKVLTFGKIEAGRLWPALAKALLGSIGRDAADLARAAN